MMATCAVTYWERRRHIHYYRAVRAELQRHGPGRAVLDVGCADTPTVTWGEFQHRTTVDPRPRPALPGVRAVREDFLHWTPPRRPFDVVLCLQVLEHLPDGVVEPFAAKLLGVARRLIITLPWGWAAGRYPPHVQDPVTWHKVRRWFPGVAPRVDRSVGSPRWPRRLLVYGSLQEGGGP